MIFFIIKIRPPPETPPPQPAAHGSWRKATKLVEGGKGGGEAEGRKEPGGCVGGVGCVGGGEGRGGGGGGGGEGGGGRRMGRGGCVEYSRA